MSSALRVASGCEVAAMPFAAIAAERPGTLKSRISLPFAPLDASRKAGAGRAILGGGLTACVPRLQGSSLVLLSLTEDKQGRYGRTVGVSGRGGAGAGRGHTDRARRPMAQDAPAIRAEPYQPMAARRRGGLDRGRYRLHPAGDARGVAAHFRRPSARPTNPASHRDPFPPRSYRHGLLADRALAGAVVDHR